MSIHGFIRKDDYEKQVPLAFVLMSRRTEEDYVMVLQKLKDVLEEPSVEGFVLDFETAAWQAVRSVFPDATIKGCTFHWSQAVWRHVQSSGLQPVYCQRQSVYLYIRQLLALPFLPAHQILGTFQELSRRANSEGLTSFVQYIERQWMRNTVFPVDSWSIFGNTIRTNNDVEGWHHRLNNRAGGMSLSFYRLVPVLRSEAKTAETDIRLVREKRKK